MSRNKIKSKRKNKTKTKYTKKKAKEKKIWATYTGCLPSKSKKEKRKKRGGNVEQGKKKSKKSGAMYKWSSCTSAHWHFCPLSSFIFSFQFYLYFDEKTF